MKSTRWSCFVLAIAMVLHVQVARAVDYPGFGFGVIPDGNPAGMLVPFQVSGFTGSLGDVRLSMTLSHGHSGDLTATLISPSGRVYATVFSRVGMNRSTPFGAGADFSGTYQFTDTGANLWDVAVPLGGTATVPAGAYRTTTRGGQSEQGGCTTSLATVFGSLPAADVNGMWALELVDMATPDAGSITGATLSLLPAANVIARNGFEVAPRGRCQTAKFDYNGDGRSDYVVVRNSGGGTSGAVTWSVKDAAGSGVVSNLVHGIASDTFIGGDWDGDGATDIVVYRPGTGSNPGQFIIRRSSRPSPLLVVPFGLTGDDPSIVDDFNGDGLTDFAVFRKSPGTGQPSTTLIQFNGESTVRSLTTGELNAFPLSGDFNGDGAADIGVRSITSGVNMRFRLFDGRSGALLDDFPFGTIDSWIVDGNPVGNGIRDITSLGISGANMTWNTRDGSTGATSLVTMPAPSEFYPLTGDYDGDGLDDYAYLTYAATPGQTQFVVRRSSNPATPLQVLHGTDDSYPVAHSRTH